MKQKLTIFLSLLLGLVLVILWLYIVDVKEMLNVFGNVKIYFIFPLLALFILVYLLRSLRWKIILSPVEHISILESYNLCMTGYFVNFLVPIHAGEVAKCMLLKKMKGTPVSQSVLSAYVDKFMDLLPVFLLLGLAPFLKSQVSSIIYLMSLILFIVFSLLVLFLLFVIRKKKEAIKFIEKVLSFLPHKAKKKLVNLFSLFIEAVGSMPRLSNRLVEIFGLTLLALAVNCVFLWLFFYSFGVSLSLLTAFIGYLLLNASFILPAPPGFSGSLELTILFIFSYLFGHDKNLVSAVAASSHIFTGILFGLFGLLAISVIGTKLSALLKIQKEDKLVLEKLHKSD
jgi:uncharacterized protein (TIRG00374 family)